MTAQFVRIEETEGADPIGLVLSGGLLPERGVTYETKQLGARHMPIGSLRATQAVTGIEHQDTEFKIYAEVPYVGPGDARASGTAQPKTPEELTRLLRFFQERGRQVQVTVGAFVRLGRLANVKAELTRGYSIDFTGKLCPPGMNAEITLTWEWSDAGERTPAVGTLGGSDLAGGLAAVSAKLPTLFAPDAFLAEIADRVRDGISSALSSVERLKSVCRRVNDVATAPARIANELLSAAKSAARSLTELDDLLTRTPEEILPAGGGFPDLIRANRAAGDLRAGVGDGMAAVVAVFDALDARKSREVGVRPGESLALVAKRELGSADRWPAIAALNEIAGQTVPPATFIVEVPGS